MRENHARYLSTLRELTRQALQALRGTPGVYDLPDPRRAGVKYLVDCARCGQVYVYAEDTTLYDAGETGFIVYSHCGLVGRTGSLTRRTLDMLLAAGSVPHPVSQPAITFVDYLEFVDAIRSTAFPQKELL